MSDPNPILNLDGSTAYTSTATREKVTVIVDKDGKIISSTAGPLP